MNTNTLITLGCLLVVITLINSQQYNISDSQNEFGINLLAETINTGGDSLNVALSPYTVWTLLTIIAEGSLENTARQLENTLRLTPNKPLLRRSFQNLSNLLLTKADGVNLELNTAIFTNQDFPIKNSFRTTSEQSYDVKVNPLNFNNPAQASSLINKHVAKATKNRITNFVNPGDVLNAQVFLTSILYFKGQWKLPFNVSATHTESFNDEKNNKIGDVDMMFKVGAFPYSRMENINAHVVELPYGEGKKMSMIVILPFKGDSVSSVLNAMSKVPFSSIIQTLENSAKEFVDEEVQVYLPKFKITSDFNLNIVLNKIGIKDVFDIDRANLLGMFDHYLFVSRLIQRAEIEVNEEGTVASAAAGASFPNRSFMPKFRANKPFLYFIVDKTTRSVLFSGKVSNPSTIRS